MVPSSFGEMLKAFRKGHRFTQQQVAAHLGVHRNTIGGWERGDFLPDSRGMVLELARHLRLDEQETRQLLEASLTALSPGWHIPHLPHPFFTGREGILQILQKRLSPDQPIALTQSHALSGLGGIGKTEIAVEYAHRHLLEYSAVFWIGAETLETIVAGFLGMADLLRLPENREADQQQVVAAVQRWLTTHKGWLLIWDNLEDLELLSRFLPSARQGTVLITTRTQALGTLAQGIEVQGMEREEGMLFLLRRAKVLSPEATSGQMHQLAESLPTEYEAAQELVTVLGGLPLALDQAGAYIEETGCLLSDYLRRYENQRARLLARRGAPVGNHPHSVMATFRLIWQRVEREHQASADLLRIASFLHAEAIPEELFATNLSPIAPALDPAAVDPLHLDLAVAALRTFSLVQRQPQTQTFSIHRLVQAVLQEGMSKQEQRQWQQEAIRRLNTLFPEVTPEAWEQCERLLLHVLTCARTIPDGAGDRELANVLRKGADYLRERAQYEQAEPLYKQALRIWNQAGEEEHPDVVSSLNGLAMLSYRQGRYAEAEALYKQALSICEHVLGAKHPQMAFSLHGLALLYTEQGKYAEAEALHKRALSIREHVLGLGHPDVASSLNGLAMLCDDQGNYEQAEALYKRALSIREQALGPEHPDLASPLNNLALLYTKRGNYEQAEALYKRALSIREQALGSENTLVAYPLNNLALLYYRQGQYEQAEGLYKRALRIWEQALGTEHLQVAYPVNGLAALYSDQGKYKQAESLYKRAIRIRERALGPEHPQVAYPLDGLADLYTEQGQYEQAEGLYKRALRIWEQALGTEHPEMADPLHGLATLYYKQDNTEEAEQLYRRALSIREQHLGYHHPDTARSLVSLARLYEKRDSYEQATLLLQQAYTTLEQCLGRAHPETREAWETYSSLLEQREGGRARRPVEPHMQEAPLRAREHQNGLPLSMPEDACDASPAPEADLHIRSKKSDRTLIHPMSVAVRGKSNQVAYTRKVSMREVTFICVLCGQTVTQLHYPSGRIKYCSKACRALRRAQRQEERVHKQREKRRAGREASN